MNFKAKFSKRALLSVMVMVSAQAFNLAAAKPPEPKTVIDFFLLVPEKYVGYDREFREEFARGERRGSIIDVRNGYLYWNASDNPEEFEFAIFKKRNGKYIAAFSSPYDDQFPNSGRFVLLSYEGGRWRDVTKALLPIKYDRTSTYGLPRHGRTIYVSSQSGRKRYALTWKNDHFSVRQLRPHRL